ncbi:hypothetical protein Bca101_083318 [Brassica carinata]
MASWLPSSTAVPAKQQPTASSEGSPKNPWRNLPVITDSKTEPVPATEKPLTMEVSTSPNFTILPPSSSSPTHTNKASSSTPILPSPPCPPVDTVHYASQENRTAQCPILQNPTVQPA